MNDDYLIYVFRSIGKKVIKDLCRTNKLPFHISSILKLITSLLIQFLLDKKNESVISNDK